jgi:hypothetical protein
MKKVLGLIILLSISILSRGQFPATSAPVGNVNTIQNDVGARKIAKGAVIGYFTDTTAANNASYVKGVPYIIITVADGDIYMRNSTATQWIKKNGGGSSTPYDSVHIYAKVKADSLVLANEINNRYDTVEALVDSTGFVVIKPNGVKDTVVFEISDGNYSFGSKVYIPLVNTVFDAGYFLGDSITRFSSFQGLNTGTNTFALLANNKYYTNGAWLDNGLNKKGSVMQMVDDKFQFYSVNTGVAFSRNMEIDGTSGRVLIGKEQNNGASSTLDIRSNTSRALRIGFPDNGDIYTYTLGRSTINAGYLEFEGYISSAGFSFVDKPVIIGAASGVNNEPSAILQIDNTSKGLLPPRMTTSQINAISSPANGLMVYNTTENTICFFNGTNWQKVTSSNL